MKINFYNILCITSWITFATGYSSHKDRENKNEKILQKLLCLLFMHKKVKINIKKNSDKILTVI